MAQINDISVYKGEAVSLTFTMSPVESVLGWTSVFTVKNNANDTGSVLSKAGTVYDSTAGKLRVNLLSSELKTTLGVGSFAYDFQRTDAGAETVLSIGRLSVLQEVLY